jgi:hypothetical protein
LNLATFEKPFNENRVAFKTKIYATIKPQIKHYYTENTYNKCMYDASYMACKQTLHFTFNFVYKELMKSQDTNIDYAQFDAYPGLNAIIVFILSDFGIKNPKPVFLLGFPVLSESEIVKPATGPTVGPAPGAKGGKPKNKIHILGRSRIVRLHDNKQTITYLGQQITIARAKQIEKKMERKQIQTSLNNIKQKFVKKQKTRKKKENSAKLF